MWLMGAAYCKLYHLPLDWLPRMLFELTPCLRRWLHNEDLALGLCRLFLEYARIECGIVKYGISSGGALGTVEKGSIH